MLENLEDLLKRAWDYFTKKEEEHHTDIYTELMNECKKRFNKDEMRLIHKAYETAEYLHRHQKRNSGEPYIIHPLYVAYIAIKELDLQDANSVCACLLHDTVEDCKMTYEHLIKHFNLDIADLVMGVTKITDLNFNSKEELEAYNYRLLLLAVLKSYRTILIKLADRLHNMRTLEYKEEPKRIAKSAETLRLFVPLADHVGAYIARDELADLSLKYLNDKEYKIIKGMRKDYAIKHQREIEYELGLFHSLLKEGNIEGNIRVSLKSNFSLYQGLTDHHKIGEVPNLIRYSIMLKNKKDINKLKELIESHFQVLPEYTKDYIKTPKSNGYEALHLSIPHYKFNREGAIELKRSRLTGEIIPIQIQIYTKEMFLINSYGFASLLEIYPNKTLEEIQQELLKTNPFFKALQENEEIENPFLFLEKTVRELLAEKIHVHVADDTVYCLPAASTVEDLAEKIHSELKNEAASAIVNGREENLDFPLKDGDHVLILTKKQKEEKSLVLTRKKD
mgnify:FL=1